MLTKRCLVPIPNMSRLLANTTKQLFANRFIAIRTRSKVVMRCSIGVARLSTIIPQQKRFSSLAGDNPMFPQRQLPEEDSNNEKNKKKNNNNDDSILANHGGKIALVALAFAAYLIYSFYKGSQNKEDQETLVRERTAIEPKEFVQLRANISEGLFLDDSDTEKKATISYDNALFHSVTKHFVEGISCQEFFDAVDFAISNYRDNFGGGSNQMISYKDFISIVTSSQTVAKKLRSYEAMYLLDRLVYTRVVLQTLEKKKDKNSSDYSIDSATRDTKRYQHYADVPVSLAYLLTAFSMVIGEETAGDQYERSADQRIKGLFHLGTKLDSNSINGSNTTNTAEDTAFMSRELIEEMLQDLIDTHQVPAEKLQIETGVNYPVKLYKKKNGADLLNTYFKGLTKEKSWWETLLGANATKEEEVDKSKMNAEEFRRLLLSYEVCAWGECHRK